MKYYTESGTPAVPSDGKPIRPQHYDPHRRRFGPSNHVAVAFNGREYILKAAKSFDVWDENVFSQWVAHLTAEQTRELERVLRVNNTSINTLLKADWTRNPEGMVARFADKINVLMAGQLDNATLAKTFFTVFKPLLLNAPEIYGHRHRYLSITRFDEHDARALDWMTKVGTDNAGKSIGKYVDKKGSQTMVNLIARNMADGYGPDEVAGKVTDYVTDKLPMNKVSYARLVSQNLMQHARSHSSITSMRQAGFTSYIWNSVLDEVTTECVLDNTLITTENGFMRAMDVQIGMRLLTRTQQWKRVKYKSIRPAKIWRCFRFDDADSTELIITPAHPISSERDWIKSQDLKRTDYANTLTHDFRMDRTCRGEVQIKEARTKRFDGIAINFEMEGDDPSYVAAGIVVHNCCRFMHGKTISIADATAVLDAAHAGGYTPEDLDKNTPFITQVGDNLKIHDTTIARVKQSAMGQWDKTGTFDDKGKDLTKMGIVAPPAHHECRSNLIPTFSTRQLAPTVTPVKPPGKAPVVKSDAPAWLQLSPWATDPVAPALMAEAQAWQSWLFDGGIPEDKITSAHVEKYLGKSLDFMASDGVVLSLKAWREGSKGRMMFSDVGTPEGLAEAMVHYPRALAALHGDLFYFGMAVMRGQLT